MKNSRTNLVTLGTFVLGVLITMGISTNALAVDRIIVGGTQYTCQFQCVTHNVNGTIYVADKYGGWIFAEPK